MTLAMFLLADSAPDTGTAAALAVACQHSLDI